MKYTTEIEKEKIKRCFKAFLISRGYTFKGFCTDNKLDYSQTYKKIFVGNIEHDFINQLVLLVDSKFHLVSFQSNFIMLKK